MRQFIIGTDWWTDGDDAMAIQKRLAASAFRYQAKINSLIRSENIQNHSETRCT